MRDTEIERDAKLQAARDEVVKTARKYKSVFGSPEGQQVLTDLVLQFNPEYICGMSGNVEQTEITVRAAQRDVIEYINRNIRVADRNFE